MNIVISGATGGVGVATAKLFASKGHCIILLGRDIKKLSKLTQDITKQHKVEVSFFKCDIDNRDELSSSIKKINELNIDIDILINISGIFPYGLVLNQNERVFDNCMDVNLSLIHI